MRPVPGSPIHTTGQVQLHRTHTRKGGDIPPGALDTSSPSERPSSFGSYQSFTVTVWRVSSGTAQRWIIWHHDPALMSAALQRSGGVAHWKPQWHVLVVPTADVPGAGNVFNLAAPDQLTPCPPSAG